MAIPGTAAPALATATVSSLEGRLHVTWAASAVQLETPLPAPKEALAATHCDNQSFSE